MHIPSGFRFAGVRCGIKASKKLDLALVVADRPGQAAGVYTQNQIVAAPVLLCRQRTPGAIRAVVVNSGNANACTGRQGERDAAQMTEWVATAVGCDPQQVLVLSTGVIGHPLPMEKLAAGIPQAVAELKHDEAGFRTAAEAILTTDAGLKVGDRTFSTPSGDSYSIAGMAKGAGMIGPNMATMLGVLVTDFPLSAAGAQHVLARVADRSFNCISVEGHTSTNDSLVLLSSNPLPSATEAANATATGETDTADLESFEGALAELCIELAKQIPADGEGATHLIELAITGARDDASAARIAKTIAQSALVKTAVTGADPNWGRIVSAAGYAGEPLETECIDLKIQGTRVYASGAPVPFDAATASAAMRDSFEVLLELKVGNGPGAARFWTSDLTADYVHFNSDYTT
ncbi:bifunctional glutamate N-acetyltransferase/amino-acid acetyltransferase ArgJ [Planctomycetaceae bacterium SH139]